MWKICQAKALEWADRSGYPTTWFGTLNETYQRVQLDPTGVSQQTD